MPSLTKHQSIGITKMILMGDSGTGKTGSLTSLVKAGYKLRILDYDNGLDVLRAYIQKECPDKIENVEFRTLRDKIKSGAAGPILDGPAKAFSIGLNMLDHWKYKTDEGEEVDLGKPGTWGKDVILVLDSLTWMSKSAFNLSRSLNPGAKEPRTWYYAAQDNVMAMLSLLTAESFGTNVIVISHVRYITREDNTTKGYPNSIGSAIASDIPTLFNGIAVTETKSGDKRVVRTASTALIDLKSPAQFKLQKELPLESGLADYFKSVRS